MSASLLALYDTPADPAAFDAHYHGTHLPLAKKVPGLTGYALSRGTIVTPAGPASYYLIATLEFASMAALQEGLASPEGRAAAGDTANFAQAGLTMLMFESVPV